jgi:hypothetical protein
MIANRDVGKMRTSDRQKIYRDRSTANYSGRVQRFDICEGNQVRSMGVALGYRSAQRGRNLERGMRGPGPKARGIERYFRLVMV